MTYEETIELEQNVKIKNRADDLYSKFNKNIKLEAKGYKGNGLFLYWSDEHNATYIKVDSSGFTVQYRFLHESYDVPVNPSSLFNLIKKDYTGVKHLEYLVSDKEYNEGR